MAFKNFVTAHSHPQSLDSGSTCEAMAKREVELGTGALTMTDHGTLGAGRAIYDLAKKHKLVPILGLEAYFRDDDCPILLADGVQKDEKGTLAEYMKYFHLTLHALDQEAYEALVRITSRAAEHRAERHGQEVKPLFNWTDLEELGGYNITVGSGCLVGMVQRHLLADTPRPDLAIKYYERMRGTFKPSNLYTEIFPHRCNTNWVKAVFLEFASSTGAAKRRYWFGKGLRVEIAGKVEELKAYELGAKFDKWNGGVSPTVRLLAVKNMQTWTDEPVPLDIIFAETVEKFLDNECTAFAPDGAVQTAANKFMLGLAAKYGDTILVSDDSHFAHPEDRVVQELRMLSGEKSKTKGSVPSWRFSESYHRQTSQEAFEHFKSTIGVPEGVFARWVENSYTWRDRFGWKFQDRKQLPTKFYPTDTVEHTLRLIKEVGRMDWSNPVWKKRLMDEMKMLNQNGVIDLLPYFFLAQDGIKHYEAQGHLPGPGRGSAAGTLLAYLLGITHVEPQRYNLSKERFLTESRIRSGKLPDIDMDFGKKTRAILVDPKTGWLKQRFGDHMAQISTDTMLRLKSSIQDTHRMLDGKVDPAIWSLTEKLQLPPQGVTDHNFVFGYNDADGMPVPGSIETDPVLKDYVVKYPKHWNIVEKALGVVKGKGRHASAYVITNEPVSNFIPTEMVGDIVCTAYNMKGVESAGGIKMDYLGISTLDDLEVAIRLVQQRAGWKPEDMVINGKKVPAMRIIPREVPHPVDGMNHWVFYDVWDLPDDQAVFNDITSGKTNKSIFQFGTGAAQQWLKEFSNPDGTSTIKSIEDLAAFTALDRPGGLDSFVETRSGVKRNMLQEFAARAGGKEACLGRLAILDELFPETYGVLTYQEQLQKAFVALGGTTPEEGDEFRVHVSKKMAEKVMADKAVFMRGAIARLGETDAERLWGMLETFANYGFNKSHAVAYTIIGYACAWFQHHFSLEWWTAVLRNADRDEIDTVFWKHAGHLVDQPDVKLSGDDFEIQGSRIRAPLRMLMGVGPTAHEELVVGRPYTDLTDFLSRIRDRKAKLDPEGKKGRSALNRGVLTKLVVSGCADALFPEDKRGDVFTKLTYFEETEAEVNNRRYKRTGALKVQSVDPGFMNLSPIQRYLLTKGVLPSFTAPLSSLVSNLGRKDFRADGNRYAWRAPDEFEGQYWTMLLPGHAISAVFDGKVPGLPPKFKFGCVAYLSETEPFWKGQALHVHFEVDGHRFMVNMWPRKRWVDGQKTIIPIKLPEGAKGGVCIITLSRWDIEKEFGIDDVCLITPAVTLSLAEASP